MNLQLLIINIIITTFSLASLHIDDHVNLIAEISKFSRCSSIALAHFSNHKNLTLDNTIFKMHAHLLKKGNVVSNINFRKRQSMAKKKYLLLRPFIRNDNVMTVFFITSNQDHKNILTVTKAITRRKSINFLLFMKIDKTDELEMCKSPEGNPINLNNGVSFLIKCYQDPMIREWHYVNNELVIYNRAIWEPWQPKIKFKLVNKLKNLVVSNRELLNRTVLQAASIKESSIIGGYFDKVCLALRTASNVKIRKKLIENNHGVYNVQNNSWSGSIGQLIDEKVDIVLGWFPLLPREISAVDHSVAIVRAECVILIKKPDRTFRNFCSIYFQPFTLGVWITIICSFLMAYFICAFLQAILQTQFSDKIFIKNDLFYVYGVFCRQELPNIPNVISLKIFYITIILFSFYIWTIYVASLVSKLTITGSGVPFKSLEEFTKVKSHKLIVFKDTVNYYRLLKSKDSYLTKAAELLVSKDELPKTKQEAVDMICEKNMALFEDDMFLPLALINDVENVCTMSMIRTGEFNSFSLILKKHSPYTAALNFYLRRLVENGIFHKLKAQIYKVTPIRYFIADIEKPYAPSTLQGVSLLLIIFLGGVIVSLKIFFLEKLYLWFQKMKGIDTSRIFQITNQLRKRHFYAKKFY